MKSGQMSTMGSYLNRIETTEEVSVARFIRTILSLSVYNFFLKPQTVKGLDVTGTASQASKRSILMNQNHMYYQLNMYSQKDAIGSFTSRTNESRNDEYLSMRKWIDQIPDNCDSDLGSHDLQNDSKFNHIYVSNMRNPWSSDINEELSVLGTDRTSELTTEHCSDAKHWHSHKSQVETRANQPLYTFNLPTL